MLNKDICQKCYKENNKAWNDDEEECFWEEEDTVFCPIRGTGYVYDYPIESCIYKKEHLEEREKCSVLKKEICEKCFEEHEQEVFVLDNEGIADNDYKFMKWSDKEEKDWEENFGVTCFLSDGSHWLSDGLLQRDGDIPEKCPYKMEYMILNQKKMI